MQEVAELEKDAGHQFIVNGERRSFAGTIAFVSGDNLASQELGGFKVGPGAHHKCRECMGYTTDIKTKVCNKCHFEMVGPKKKKESDIWEGLYTLGIIILIWG
jgi:hypothetical protein